MPVATAAMRANVASARVENSSPDMRPSPPLAPIVEGDGEGAHQDRAPGGAGGELRADHDVEPVGGMRGEDGERADQPAGAHDRVAAEPSW